MRSKIQFAVVVLWLVFLTACASTPENEYFYNSQQQKLLVQYQTKMVNIRLPENFELFPLASPCCQDASFLKNGEKITIPFMHYIFTNRDFSEILILSLTSDFNLSNAMRAQHFLEIEEEIEDYFTHNSIEDYVLKNIVKIQDEDLPPEMQIFDYRTVNDFANAIVSVENDQVVLGNIITLSGDYTLGPLQTHIAQSFYEDQPIHMVVSYIAKMDKKSNYDAYLRTIFLEATGI